MRIDTYLAESGILASRTEAKRFIEQGAVSIGGKVVTKPSTDVSGLESLIQVNKSIKQYVSRGGIKLKGAIDAFNLDCSNRECLDVGASSGGFTDCLLKEGASHVISVDSGSGQIVDALRRDERVTVVENYNARYMKPSDFEYRPNLAVMDVSFISATYIMPALYLVLDDEADFICLVKPQFEVGRSGLGKGGIVKNSTIRDNAVKKVIDFAADVGFILKKIIESPIRGGDGNIEYLAHFIKCEGELSYEKGSDNPEYV